MSQLQCPGWQDVQAKKLKCSFLVMAYSVPFNNVFETFNNYFILMQQNFNYLAMAFGSSQEHRVLARVLPWGTIGDFHHII